MTFKWKGWMILGLVLALAVFLAGRWPNRVGSLLTFQGTSLESKDNLSSFGADASAGNTRFACQTALLVNESGDPLAARVFEALRQRLQNSLQITAAPYGAPNLGLAPRARLPDLVIRLDAPFLKQDGMIPLQKLRATFTVSMGQTPRPDGHGYFATESLPLVQSRWTCTMEHESTVNGLETRNYAAVSEHLAKAIGEAILKNIDEQRTKYGALPELPLGVYGPYHKAPTLRLPEDVQACQILTADSLFHHNETFWSFAYSGDLPAFFNQIQKQYEAEGWKREGGDSSPGNIYLRMTRENQMLNFYSTSPNDRPLGAPSKTKTEQPTQFAVHFEESFSKAERTTALDALFAANLPVETLLLFDNLLFPSQKQALAARIQNAQPCAPAAWIYLARDQEKPVALQSLKRAKALLATLQKPDDVESSIKQAAKEIAGDTPLVLTAADYKEAGFEELTESPRELERAPGQPALFFYTEPNGAIRTTCLRVCKGKGEKNTVSYEMSVIETQANGRSWTSSKDGLSANDKWQHAIEFGPGDRRFTAMASTREGNEGVLFSITPRETASQGKILSR